MAGIVYIVGARPNFVKMAPVVAALRRRLPNERHILVHTGQHYDRAMSGTMIEELGMPDPAHVLEVGSASHAVQTARVMERIEPVLKSELPDLVMVPGDVNSTLGVALVAVKLGFPLAHVEAGLRSFDRSMPEEINRIVADQFSDYLFIHSAEAERNLLTEGIDRSRIHFVGNTMIDSLLTLRTSFQQLKVAASLGLEQRAYLLVTLHRPALVDGVLLGEVVSALGELARELPVVFPAHPRTMKMIGSSAIPAGVRIIDPVSYLEFLSLEAGAAAVLTDSGGVQEETTFLGVPCFTLRDNTERPVTVRVGTNTVLGLRPEAILSIPEMLSRPRSSAAEPAGWDGNAAERVADVVVSSLYGRQGCDGTTAHATTAAVGG